VQGALQRSAPNPGPPTLAPSPALAKGTGAAKELIQRVRQVIRQRHYSLRTERSYASWVHRSLVSTATTTRPGWVRPRSGPT
jgi:hypothetical protein